MQGRRISQEEKEKLQQMIEQGSTTGIDLDQDPRPVQSNEARLSLIMGCLGLASMLFISFMLSELWAPGLAIYFGIKGLHTINKKGGVLYFTGEGMAIAGILLGILSYVIFILKIIGTVISIRS